MPSPDFEAIVSRYMEQYESDGVSWRSTLTPEAYGLWKANMVAKQMSKQRPDWQNGHPREVEQKVFGEWFGDDFVGLRVALRGHGYTEEVLQLFLARPWYAVNAYYQEFSAYMSEEWRNKLYTFLVTQEPGVTAVIEESVDMLDPGKLRRIASEFDLAAWNFRTSYGKFNT